MLQFNLYNIETNTIYYLRLKCQVECWIDKSFSDFPRKMQITDQKKWLYLHLLILKCVGNSHSVYA